ncbi:TauD/TfdA family dioxygenase [Streptomyces sp. NPDC047981]|uniref:TauD/TfdA family dioxygenase n=1 Tax=Streptomyces sp. NPDC047981 TaxID=3154610 RepID=UPI00344715DB
MRTALFHRREAAPPPALPEIETTPSAGAGAGAAAWAAEHASDVLAVVAEHGAAVVTGLDLRTVSDVEAVLGGLGVPPVREAEGFAARTPYADGVYSSAAWPARQPMCMHHELSYAGRFPGLLLFACLRAPGGGGATALADAAAVLEALPSAIVERFEQEGWLLTRAYHEEIGTSLTQAFGTTDPRAIDAYCRDNGIVTDWQPDGSLRTRQHRRAVVSHPRSGRRCWFNQVAFLNQWTMDPEVRAFLIEEYGPEGLPFNTSYGNGDGVASEAVEQINEVYEAHTVRRPWQDGDLMLVDNIRTAHSREPYEGPRQVVVAMAEPQRQAPPAASTGRAAA